LGFEAKKYLKEPKMSNSEADTYDPASGKRANTVSRPVTACSNSTHTSLPTGKNTSMREPNLMNPTSSP
jgi:hypothetical protein